MAPFQVWEASPNAAHGHHACAQGSGGHINHEVVDMHHGLKFVTVGQVGQVGAHGVTQSTKLHAADNTKHMQTECGGGRGAEGDAVGWSG